MSNLLRAGVVGALAVLLASSFALFSPTTVSAHERRTVADEYEFVVGFLDEPAFEGLKNGLDLRISQINSEGGDPIPVEFAEETLQAEVIYGEETMELEIGAAWNNPGAYRSHFFPNAAGDYTFRIFGTLEGVEIDETFTSGPETFSVVEPIEPLLFPKNVASGETTQASTFSLTSGSLSGAVLALALVAAAVTAMSQSVTARRWVAQRVSR